MARGGRNDQRLGAALDRQPYRRSVGPTRLPRPRAAPTLAGMCGRYASFLPAEALARIFGTVNPLPNIDPSWNLAPSQPSLVVRRHPQTAMTEGRHHAPESLVQFPEKCQAPSRQGEAFRIAVDDCPNGQVTVSSLDWVNRFRQSGRRRAGQLCPVSAKAGQVSCRPVASEAVSHLPVCNIRSRCFRRRGGMTNHPADMATR
jgi:hypothetical protein